MNQKGFAKLVLIGIFLVLVVIAGYFVLVKKAVSPVINEPSPISTDETANWKTYANTQYGFEFKYPEKLSLSVSGGIVNLSHTIPFENRDGGCDMKGDAELSKTLVDFGLSIKIVSGEVNPPYVDGTYAKGELNGKWAYMGAEGCGETNYYFPMAGNKTLIITKTEVQILSPIVTPEVRAKVLAVPGVISYEDSKILLGQILSSFKFTK